MIRHTTFITLGLLITLKDKTHHPKQD